MGHAGDAAFRLVLATDLDDTLVGDPEALAELNSRLARRRSRVFLIYLTGRHSFSAVRLICAEALLLPDVLVSDAGTIVRYRPAFRRDRAWESRFAARWPREEVRTIAAGVPGLTAQAIHSPWRCAYYLEDEWALPRLVEALAGLAVRVVATGRCVDVIPAGAGKGAALDYLVARFGLPAAQLLVCGDGGNDLDMLRLGYRGVLVGNGKISPSLLPPTVYQAREPFAAGILEALRHFDLLP